MNLEELERLVNVARQNAHGKSPMDLIEIMDARTKLVESVPVLIRIIKHLAATKEKQP